MWHIVSAVYRAREAELWFLAGDIKSPNYKLGNVHNSVDPSSATVSSILCLVSITTTYLTFKILIYQACQAQVVTK